MADTKLPVISIRHEYRSMCGTGRKSEFSSLLEVSQRKELLLLQRAFRAMHQHGEVLLCSQNTETDAQGRVKNRKLQAIMNLQTTKEELKNLIEKANDDESHKRAEESFAKTKKLLREYESNVEYTKQCLQNLLDISTAVDTMVSSITKMQLKWRRLYSTVPTPEYYDRRVRDLEITLHITTSRWNTVCSNSAQLRHEISDMLLDRKTFFDAYRSYHRSLNSAKTAQAKIVNKAYTTYEVIEDAKYRLKQIRKHALDDCRQHKGYIIDQKRILDDYWRIRHFNDIKNHPRPTPAKTLSRRERENRVKLQACNRLLARCKWAFQQIRDMMKTLDQNRILHVYQGLEDDNLVTLSSNSNLNSEVQCLEDQVRELKKCNLELKRARQLRANNYKERKNRARKLLQANQRIKDVAKRDLQAVQTHVAVLESEVARLYNLVDGDQAAVQQLLGERNKHIPGFFMQSLKAVERRCLQLLKIQDDLQVKQDRLDGKRTVKFLGSNLPRTKMITYHRGPSIPKVLITGHQEMIITEDEDDSKTFLVRVHTKAEIIAYIRAKMQAAANTDDSAIHSGVSSAGTSTTNLSSQPN